MSRDELPSLGPGFRLGRVPRADRPPIADQIENLPPSVKPVVSPLFQCEDWAGKSILEHRATLIKLLWMWVEDEYHAEDLISELYIRASRHPEPDHPERWLVRVARNLAIDHFRATSLNAARLRPLPDDEILAADHDDPSAFEELREMLQDAIRRLQEDHQEFIVARFLEGRKIEEIARQMGIGKSTAHLRLNQAKEELRTILSR